MAKSNSEKLAAQREVNILDSQNKTGHADVFLHAAAIQQVIHYPINLRDHIDSLIFKEKQLLEK